MLSRRARWRCIHSIWSAYTFGVATSTDDGKFMMILLSGVAPQAAVTASQTSSENSSSVAENVSGLYSNTQSVSGRSAANCLTRRAEETAISRTSALLIPNTISRKGLDIALTTWTIARRVPIRDSIVRRIRCSRACVSTSIVTSFGM